MAAISQTPRVLVLVPTYDEAENLGGLLDGLRAVLPAAEILVLDDDSPDGTGALAAAFAAADPRVRVRHRRARAGLGAAYLEGFAVARDEGFELLVQIDADGSHPVAQLPGMVRSVSAGADLVIGSRWAPGGRVVAWSWYRRLLSRGGNAYARTMLSLPVRDATSGFRVWRAAALAAIPLDQVVSRGYCFQVDLTRRAVAAGLSILEHPITFTERVAGRSKMTIRIALEAIWRVTGWALQRFLSPRSRRDDPR